MFENTVEVFFIKIVPILQSSIQHSVMLFNSSLLSLSFTAFVPLTNWFQVLTASSMKMTVVWDVVPCSLVEVEQRFRGARCLHHQGDDDPNDGGSKHLRNVGKLLPDYTAQHPRRQSSLPLNNCQHLHTKQACTPPCQPIDSHTCLCSLCLHITVRFLF
jgi:hypothetical protein